MQNIVLGDMRIWNTDKKMQQEASDEGGGGQCSVIAGGQTHQAVFLDLWALYWVLTDAYFKVRTIS